MEIRTKKPIHIQAIEELEALENQKSKKLAKLGKLNRKPNPFASSVFPSNPKFSGTKVMEGGTKTQFRIRPQTPKLDMILLQKAKRKQLQKITKAPAKKVVVTDSAPKIQKRRIKI